MTKSSHIGRSIRLFSILLTAMSGVSVEALDNMYPSRLEPRLPGLELDTPVKWREVGEIGPRCFSVELPGPGIFWLELAVSTPTTAPELLLLGPPRDASHGGMSTKPAKLLERTQTVMLEVSDPGDYLVCLTSQAPLGEVELLSSFFREPRTKDEDPKESEIEPDPEP